MCYTFIFLGAIIAFWISAICGGGASLILIPVLGTILPSTQIPTALTIGTFTSSASRIAVFRKQINWKIVKLFVPTTIPAVWLGAWLLKFVNPLYLELFIGIFLIGNLPQLFMSKTKVFEVEKPYPPYVLSIVGFLAGFVSGVTGAVGLLFNRFYLRYGLSKEEIVATRAANEIILHLIKLILYCALGIASTKAIIIGLLIAAGAIVSSITVKYVLPFLSEVLFRKVGYSAMVFSGIFLLTSTTKKIIASDQPDLHMKLISDDIETQLSWRQSLFSLEFNYDEGFEMEQSITYSELPLHMKRKFDQLSEGAESKHYEKVNTFHGVFYEIYFVKNGKLEKYEMN